MRSLSALPGIVAVLVVFAHASFAAEPIGRQTLLDLAEAEVDPSLIQRLVERDCVAFEIDAEALLELAPRLPREILDAAMSCRDAPREKTSPPPCAADAPAPLAEAASERPGYDLSELRRVALVPLVHEGVADEALTEAFRDETLRRGVTFELLDAGVLASAVPAGAAVDSDAPLDTLLPLARAAGAQALFVGSATTRSVVGNPALHVQVRLLETEHGHVLWQGEGAAQGGAFAPDQRRRIAARNALRRLPW